MSQVTIKFMPHDKQITVDSGHNLLRAAMDAGVHINASCGGEGVCGKCRVRLEEGTVEGGGQNRVRPEDWEKGFRLACQSTVNTDLVVRVPVESSVDASVLNMAASPRKTARIQETDLEQLREQGLLHPAVEKKCLDMEGPSATDNVSDVTRLINHLRVQEEEHKLEVDLEVLRKVPDTLREQEFKATATLARPVRGETGKTRIINMQAGDTTRKNYALAVDIGTTTVYAQLVDMNTGKVAAQFGDFNGQISYGEDVISRIIYAEKPGGLERLHEVVVETINKLIRKVVKRSKIDPDDISISSFAGNTTMTQLFLAINPRYIRRSPYVPAANLYPPIQARDLGLELPGHVTALVYPCISSYVGGDIVSGIMGSGMYRSDELTLYIDIGTNAEIVVGNKEWMMCAACSAGPAFEGGGVEHGMRATKGAIEDFSLDPVTWEPMNLTIGNTRPKGICGSGLIIMLARMFESGLLDSQGKFNREAATDRIRERDNVVEYVVAWKEETQVGRDIVLTEPDIDNLIRAKGAMYSGYMTLLSEVGVDIAGLDRVYLAGGFGSYVDLESAMTIGLLPEMDPEKVVYLGNGSLMGAKMTSLTNNLRRDVVEVTRKITNFELSETGSYMDNYIASLFLPHTDLDLFPRLKQRMEERKSL